MEANRTIFQTLKFPYVIRKYSNLERIDDLHDFFERHEFTCEASGKI